MAQKIPEPVLYALQFNPQHCLGPLSTELGAAPVRVASPKSIICVHTYIFLLQRAQVCKYCLEIFKLHLINFVHV